VNDHQLPIFERAPKIFLVSTATRVSIKNVRFALDVFDQIGMENDKTHIVLNRVWDERKGKSATISVEKVESYLKRPVIGRIPQVDERLILSAINRGIPVIGADRDLTKPPIKQLVELSDETFRLLMGEEELEEEGEVDSKPRSMFPFRR